MDVLTPGTCWALNNEIIKQVTSSWSLFTQNKVRGFNFKISYNNNFCIVFQIGVSSVWNSVKRWRQDMLAIWRLIRPKNNTDPHFNSDISPTLELWVKVSQKTSRWCDSVSLCLSSLWTASDISQCVRESARVFVWEKVIICRRFYCVTPISFV